MSEDSAPSPESDVEAAQRRQYLRIGGRASAAVVLLAVVLAVGDVIPWGAALSVLAVVAALVVTALVVWRLVWRHDQLWQRRITEVLGLLGLGCLSISVVGALTGLLAWDHPENKSLRDLASLLCGTIALLEFWAKKRKRRGKQGGSPHI